MVTFKSLFVYDHTGGILYQVITLKRLSDEIVNSTQQ